MVDTIVRSDIWVPNVLITHAPCSDGATSKFIAREFYTELDRWGSVVCLDGDYGNPKGWWKKHIKPHMKVMMADFSFKLPEMQELLEIVDELVILDHHVTAQNDLKDYIFSDTDHINIYNLQNWFDRNVDRKPFVRFDMKKSGAGLCWSFFNPKKVMPYSIAVIQDCDLGKNLQPDDAAFISYVRSYPPTDEGIEKALNPAMPYEAKIKAGNHIDRFRTLNNQQIAEQISSVISIDLPINAVETKTFKVAIVNAPFPMASDIANLAYRSNEEADFGLAWIKKKRNEYQLSLRSDDDHQDVSLIAKALGGGGHRNASGVNLTGKLFAQWFGPVLALE